MSKYNRPGSRNLPPERMWVLIDVANGDAGYNDGGHNYIWWFYTKKAALEHKKHQNSVHDNAKLVGPWRYTR